MSPLGLLIASLIAASRLGSGKLTMGSPPAVVNDHEWSSVGEPSAVPSLSPSRLLPARSLAEAATHISYVLDSINGSSGVTVRVWW